MMKLQVWFSLAGLPMLCLGQYGGPQMPLPEIERQVNCARALSKTIGHICYGVRFNDKMAVDHSDYQSIGFELKNEEPKTDWPWSLPNQTKRLFRPSRDWQHIVKKCCDRPCSMAELMMSC